MNLLDVIQQDVTLRRAGRELVGLCPFHQEQTPSFYVNADKGVYLCRGCLAAGDVVSYLVAKRGLTMREALRRTGKEAPVPAGETEQERRRRIAREAIIEEWYLWRHAKYAALNDLHHELFLVEHAYRSCCRAPDLWPADEQSYIATYLGDLYAALDVALQEYAVLCEDQAAWELWRAEVNGTRH